MDKYLMIELMVAFGRISFETACALVNAHYDIVESAWFDTLFLDGAFSNGEVA